MGRQHPTPPRACHWPCRPRAPVGRRRDDPPGPATRAATRRCGPAGWPWRARSWATTGRCPSSDQALEHVVELADEQHLPDSTGALVQRGGREAPVLCGTAKHGRGALPIRLGDQPCRIVGCHATRIGWPRGREHLFGRHRGGIGQVGGGLGLLEHLGRRVGRVLPFRPIVPAVGEDALLDVLRARLGPESPPTEDLCGVSYEEVHADLDAAMSDIVDRFHAVADRCDLVLVIGSDFSDIATPPSSRSTPGSPPASRAHGARAADGGGPPRAQPRPWMPPWPRRPRTTQR